MDMSNLPTQGLEQNWNPTANPEPGIWSTEKITWDARSSGNPYHFVGGSSAAEGHGPFDDYGPVSTPQNSQWESGGF